MPESPNQKEGIESRHDAEVSKKKKKRKGTNLGAITENLKQNEGIESGRDVGELKTNQRDRIRAQCMKTLNKRKGSNPGAMQENPKQNKGYESEHDA